MLVQTMDISKMTTGDASFTAPFKLVAERDDYIHALVAYFDVSFTQCHKLTGFSTGMPFISCILETVNFSRMRWFDPILFIYFFFLGGVIFGMHA